MTQVHRELFLWLPSSTAPELDDMRRMATNNQTLVEMSTFLGDTESSVPLSMWCWRYSGLL
jgi:hypothetical protein